jgi:hypothetical protein
MAPFAFRRSSISTSSARSAEERPRRMVGVAWRFGVSGFWRRALARLLLDLECARNVHQSSDLHGPLVAMVRLQQGFAAREIGFRDQVAWRHFAFRMSAFGSSPKSSERANLVRNASKADVSRRRSAGRTIIVRFGDGPLAGRICACLSRRLRAGGLFPERPHALR